MNPILVDHHGAEIITVHHEIPGHVLGQALVFTKLHQGLHVILETRIALEEIAARFPNYEVDESGMTRTYQAHVKGYVNLPISTGN